MENKIPFSIELWNTGKYEAAYRGFGIPKELAVFKSPITYPIISIDGNYNQRCHSLDGKEHRYKESIFDIFLIPKTEEVTGWLNVDTDGYGTMFPTEKQAADFAKGHRNICVACIPITYKRPIQ